MVEPVSKGLDPYLARPPHEGKLKGGGGSPPSRDSISSSKPPPDQSLIEVYLRRVLQFILKVIITIHDALFIPVRVRYREKASLRAQIAADLIRTCTPERVNRGQFKAEDLVEVFQLIDREFYQALVKALIKKVEGKRSRAYREKVWETMKPAQFVEDYLTLKPYNFSIFLEQVLKDYL